MKTYSIMHNIGKAKYCVNWHNGIETHKDGSPFFNIAIFKNKLKMEAFISELKANSYTKN